MKNVLYLVENNPEASYRQLVDALHTLGYHRIADQLCLDICKK